MALTTGGKTLFGLAIFAGVFGGLVVAKNKGYFGEKVGESAIPMGANLPGMIDQKVVGQASLSIPTAKPAAIGGPCINRDIWEWNAQMGEIYAVGGKVTHEGSLMAKKGLCVHLNHQDDTGKNQQNLIKFATDLASGNPQPDDGATFVGIMGDGAGQFLAAVQPQLLKLGPEYQAKIVASFGFSRGEDKFMAPPACANAQSKEDRQAACKGLLIAGVLKDGDWNIAMKFAHDNDIPNNPDQTTYDPEALNWVNPSDYIDAGTKYIADYCESRDKVLRGHKTGEKVHVCVNGVVTWTPGDVNVAEKRGGLQTVVSTKEYNMQMPHVLIGIDKWMQDNRKLVDAYIDAALEGGRQVQVSDAALDAAAFASADAYGDQDASYWKTYYRGISKSDAKGLTVSLGGSKVNNLPENKRLFGLDPAYANALAATYTTFGAIVMQQYPKDVASIPPIDSVLDTSYLKDVLKTSTTMAQAERPVYTPPTSITKEISSQSWHINFKSGKADFGKDADPQLKELMNGLVIAGNTTVKIEGYTDNTGSAVINKALSEARAEAVKKYLQANAPGNFPDNRLTIDGFGSEKPIALNTTTDGRAKNRRVEVRVMHN
jgi:outer membrane protein OmpA-like peptidoglycan-associated protein